MTAEQKAALTSLCGTRATDTTTFEDEACLIRLGLVEVCGGALALTALGKKVASTLG